VAGRERRFALDTNHVITKQIVKKPGYDVFAVEKLNVRTRKENGKKFNKMLGGWSHRQLQSLLKYKAEDMGKIVIEVNPRYTSQRCSKCGYKHREKRNGLRFKCRQCGFELNADLNAARNIGQLGKSKLIRLQVNQPIVAPIGSYKPELFGMSGS
jgi:putative transposase